MKSSFSVNEIKTDEVEFYLCSQYQLPDNTFGIMENYVKDIINQWDYNRMEAKVFESVRVEASRKCEAWGGSSRSDSSGYSVEGTSKESGDLAILQII